MGASTGSAGSTSAPTSPGISNPSSTPPPSPTDLPGEVVTYEQQHAEDLKALAHEIAEWPENIRVALARSWPDPSVLPYPGTVRDGDAQWTADQLPLISKLLAAAGAPFGPWNMNDTTPPRERAFVTAPPPNDDKAPVERPTLDLLTDAVRAADATVVARINRWLTEAHEAGVAFSPLAMPNVGNYERLRLALRLAEFAEDDYDLLLALCSDEPDAGPVGPLIGRMTGAMAQAAWQRIDDLANGRSALLYTDDGAPRIVPTIGEST